MSRKIMFVSSITRYGGGERWMCDAAGGLKSRGYEVMLAARPNSVLLQKAAALGRNCSAVQMRSDFDPAAIFALTRLVRSFGPEVVIPNLDREIRLCAAALWAAARLPGGKRSRDRRRIKLIPRRGSEFPLKDKFHYRQVYTRAVHSVITNSQATKDTMLSRTPWFPRDKAAVIYNGIDTAEYDSLAGRKAEIRQKVRQSLGLSESARLVTLVGELNERKGQQHVIESAASILKTRPDTHFLFVGEGDARSWIEEQLAGHKLEDTVFLLGFRKDVAEVITASDVLILPSRVEGFGYVLVEAMAAGLPVVATRVSSIVEVVKDGVTGFLHGVGENEAMAGHIIRLLADPELAASMGRAGRARVDKLFTLHRMLDDLEAHCFG
jgi:glycosyltransferase involved in cell wall biosynthesis